MSVNEPEERVWDLETAKLLMAYAEYIWGKEKTARGDQA